MKCACSFLHSPFKPWVPLVWYQLMDLVHRFHIETLIANSYGWEIKLGDGQGVGTDRSDNRLKIFAIQHKLLTTCVDCHTVITWFLHSEQIVNDMWIAREAETITMMNHKNLCTMFLSASHAYRTPWIVETSDHARSVARKTILLTKRWSSVTITQC